MVARTERGGTVTRITPKTVQATREWFAQNGRDCIEGATAGKWHVNDLSRYVEWQNRRIAASLAGEYDHTLTFVQRALYIQTGVSVPLL
jgi:hypothetical protein